MNNADPTGKPWNDNEVDLIVADYFAMLTLELSRQPYVKSHRNSALQDLTGRSHGSIEYKHQNISAVLQQLGRPWIIGYKPAANFQNALIDGIERFIETVEDVVPLKMVEISGVDETVELFVENPPALNPGNVDVQAPKSLERLIRKFDPAARDARNRALGERGEERIYFSERTRLAKAGRTELSKKVRWVSKEDGDGAGYDILSFSDSGDERLLEVKTTTGPQRTPFYLTENERAVSAERPNDFRLVRVYDFLRTPRVFELEPPLEQSMILQPQIYRASFG
jgi:hypothetical protein